MSSGFSAFCQLSLMNDTSHRSSHLIKKIIIIPPMPENQTTVAETRKQIAKQSRKSRNQRNGKILIESIGFLLKIANCREKCCMKHMQAAFEVKSQAECLHMVVDRL